MIWCSSSLQKWITKHGIPLNFLSQVQKEENHEKSPHMCPKSIHNISHMAFVLGDTVRGLEFGGHPLRVGELNLATVLGDLQVTMG